MLKDQRGLSLIQIIFYVAIVLIISVGAITAASAYMGKSQKDEIEGFKNTLESASKSHYTNNTTYPTKPPLKFEESKLDTHFSNFFKQIAYFSGLTTKSMYEGKNKEYASDYDPDFKINSSSPEATNIDKVIMSKVTQMDIEGMVANSYMAKKPKNPDNYFIHTTTGFVYYVDEDMSIEEISNEAKRLVSDSGGITDLQNLGSITIAKDGKKMDKIISSVTNGSVVVYGGAGSIVLAKVKISKNEDGSVSHEITDLTDTLLQGTGTTDGITELRLMESNKVLAHYYDKTASKMMYRTISIE